MTESTASRITKLNNHNYQTWKFKIELLLTKEDLWDTISEDSPNPTNTAWQLKDRKARATIGLLVEDNQLNLIRKLTTAKETWDALKKYHEKSTLSNKVNLLKKLCGLKLTETGNMEQHLAKMEDLIDQLSSLGESFAEHLTVAIFLSSLPDSYGTLITALETRPEEDLTQELVKNKLLEEYKRRTEMTTSVTEHQEQQAMNVHATRENQPNVSTRRSTLTCFFCKKPNHIKKDCRKYIEWKKKHPEHKVKAVKHFTQVNDKRNFQQGYDVCSIARTANIINSWYIDSGATSHMCGDRNFFAALDKRLKVEVVQADGGKLTSSGIGYGYLQNFSPDGNLGLKIKLLDVLFVPELKGNLISVKKLTSFGFEIHLIRDGKIMSQAVCWICSTLAHPYGRD